MIYPWPVAPPTWLQSWVIWRFQGKPVPRPLGIPVGDLDLWAWGFLKWCEWRRNGKPPPRPDGIPVTIPSWAFAVLKILNQAVPVIPPPPPPPPPPPVPPNSWTLPNPIVWTAWGWLVDADFRDTDVALERMFNAGARTVALQIGQFPPAVPDRCRAYGLKVALWGLPEPNDQAALDAADADGYVPQIEGPWQYSDTLRNIQAGIGAGLALSTVTTLASLDTFISLPDGSTSTQEVEDLKAAGLNHAWVECYEQEGVNFETIMWSTTANRGFAHANPLLGLYHDFPFSEYQPEVAPYGRQVGCYLAETMSPADWVALKALGT